MIVTTKSGSTYIFTVKDSKLYFLKGDLEGIVSSISGLEIGKKLYLYFYPLDQCYNQSSELQRICSTPIISIE